MEMTKDRIVAMAVAAIAEELQQDISHIRVVSFREITKESCLKQYLEANGIEYKKFQIGD